MSPAASAIDPVPLVQEVMDDLPAAHLVDIALAVIMMIVVVVVTVIVPHLAVTMTMIVSVVIPAPHPVAAVLLPSMTTHHHVVAAVLRILTVVATTHRLIHTSMAMADLPTTDLLHETTPQESPDMLIMTAAAVIDYPTSAYTLLFDTIFSFLHWRISGLSISWPEERLRCGYDSLVDLHKSSSFFSHSDDGPSHMYSIGK